YDANKSEDQFRDKGFRSKVFNTAILIGDAAATEADRSANGDFVKAAERMFNLANETGSAEKDTATRDEKIKKLEAKLAAAKEAFATADVADKVDQELAQVLKDKKPKGVEKAQQTYAKALQQFPRLAQNAELKAKFDTLQAEEPKWIAYRPM